MRLTGRIRCYVIGSSPMRRQATPAMSLGEEPLDESDTPQQLLAFFDDAFTFSEARSGGHILVYFIPGEGANVRRGFRRLNWVWYVRADGAELARALVDKDGKRHHASLPQGPGCTGRRQ